MKISVVIPLYNKENIIVQSLNSVISQDYCNLEIIIINDGSTDNSAELVKAIHDDRVHFFEQPNGGPSKARNTGMKYATGDWILFLDADDELLPHALCILKNLIDDHKEADIVCCPFYINKNGRNRIAKCYKEGFIKNNFKSHYYGEFIARTGATIFRKEFIQMFPFDERIRRFEDLEQLFRVFRKAYIYIGTLPILQLNCDYAAASSGRKKIKEDFLGYLDFQDKSFWEKMCMYKFYLGERPNYQEQCNVKYPKLRWRYDLLILNKFLSLL